MACEESLNSRESLAPPMADLCQLIQLILTMNFFNLNNHYYLKTHGMAMVTRMAPS